MPAGIQPYRGNIIRSVLFCAVFTALFVGLTFAKSFIPNNFERLAHGIIGTIAAFITTALFLKYDRKKFADIGLVPDRKTIMKFFVGVFAGLVIMGLLAIMSLWFSHVEIEINPASSLLHFLRVTVFLIPLAFMEELGFRAYPLEILKENPGVRLSILITSLLFALYHIANGWSIGGSFYGPAVWGLIFGLAAIYSKGIAMSTGIHYAANLTTSAFGETGNSTSIWVIKQAENINPGSQVTNEWVAIAPNIALLIFGWTSIEFYIRKKKIFA